MSGKVLMWEHHSWGSPIRVGGRAMAEGFLARGWEVAWINGPLAPWNLAGGSEETRRRRRAWATGGEEITVGAGRLHAWAPLSGIPYRSYPILRGGWFHRHALGLAVPPFLRHLRRHGFERVDLLWLATGSPFLPLLEQVPHATSVYRLSDDTAAFPDTPSSYRSLEEEMMGRVDCVVATAATLAERAARFCRRVLLLPNGVDLARFRPPAGEERGDKADRRPRLVYVGALDSWFDGARIDRIARRFPGAEILLAGPLRGTAPWAQRENVRLLGAVPPEEVPALLRRCDVGLIPFVDSRLTRAIHPVKLYEYCAAGLPVVAADLDEIRRIGSPARLASSDEEWFAAIEGALQDPDPAGSIAFAAQHDWSARFARLAAFLELSEAVHGARRVAR
ncbi:MAG TPA: glycosyltransferase [Candidatus Polarisedimenticolia bacterium]|nr:glycosyltransferase [Candidatus Polarisedimenticolia bacterium]